MSDDMTVTDVTVCCESMSGLKLPGSYYTIVLSISVIGLFGIELTPELGLKFTVTGLS